MRCSAISQVIIRTTQHNDKDVMIMMMTIMWLWLGEEEEGKTECREIAELKLKAAIVYLQSTVN